MLSNTIYIFNALKLLALIQGLMVIPNVNPGLNNEIVSLEYIINDESILEVNGKTNVNSFCCTANENFSRKKITYRYNEEGTIIAFEQAKLTLNTDKLDCGRKVINNDMRKALQADKYPNIVLQLKEIQNLACHDLSVCNELVELIAVTDITITCNTKNYSFPVIVNKLDDNYFRVSGETTLQLCDFDIDAPTALLGLIKVKDELNIGFDLYIEIA